MRECRDQNIMTSKETQPTATATDPSYEHADDPIPTETVREGSEVEDPQTKDPQADTKATQTQPAHIDADSEVDVERQEGTDDEEEEKEEPEDDGPPKPPKWRIRGPTTHGVSRGQNRGRGRG
ncbi:hypothetical protein AB1N83_007698 [Pleurotus pulmonarius]